MSQTTSQRSDCGNGTGSSDDKETSHNPLLLNNPNINETTEDVLYHLALGNKTHDLPRMFGDVKFVVMGGSPRRMELFAHFMLKELHYMLPAGQTLENIARATDRYVLYKVGPVLIASHGIGFGSISIVMHELFKLLFHAKAAADVTFFRIGTSGGLGSPPGTAVVSDSTVDGVLEPFLEVQILGKTVRRPAVLDVDLARELVSCAKPDDDFETILGKTMGTSDFYEGQSRVDGAYCDYTEEDKMEFLKRCYDEGIRNIEMESICFAAMCHRANIRGAVVCTTIVNRLKGDQIDSPREDLNKWEQRPAKLVSRWIKKQLGIED